MGVRPLGRACRHPLGPLLGGVWFLPVCLHTCSELGIASLKRDPRCLKRPGMPPLLRTEYSRERPGRRCPQLCEHAAPTVTLMGRQLKTHRAPIPFQDELIEKPQLGPKASMKRRAGCDVRQAISIGGPRTSLRRLPPAGYSPYWLSCPS